MGIKRTVDPDGIYPNLYHATVDSDEPELLEAFWALLTTNTHQGRIDRFRQLYPHLKVEADALQDKLNTPRKNRDYWDMVTQSILAAEANAIIESLRIKIQRDNKRQNGTRKKRMPEINAWIEKRLRVDSSLKSGELWVDAPDFVADAISVDRFKKRVTEVRKKISCAASN